MSIAFKPLVNSSPLYTRLSSGERMMSLTTLLTAVSVILSNEDDTSLYRVKKQKEKLKVKNVLFQDPKC